MLGYWAIGYCALVFLRDRAILSGNPYAADMTNASEILLKNRLRFRLQVPEM
jgi:hypothetical protein